MFTQLYSAVNRAPPLPPSPSEPSHNDAASMVAGQQQQQQWQALTSCLSKITTAVSVVSSGVYLGGPRAMPQKDSEPVKKRARQEDSSAAAAKEAAIPGAESFSATPQSSAATQLCSPARMNPFTSPSKSKSFNQQVNLSTIPRPSSTYLHSPTRRIATIIIPDTPPLPGSAGDLYSSNREAARKRLALSNADREQKRRATAVEEGTEAMRRYGLNPLADLRTHRTDATKSVANGAPYLSAGNVGELEAYVVDERCSDEQRAVLNAVGLGRNIVITGSAGVGKSFMLAEVVRLLRSMSKKCSITAMTGTAAVHIQGDTVHRWSSMKLGQDCVGTALTTIERAPRSLERWVKTEVLIIDEMSMMNPDFFTKMNVLAKLIRKDVRPFGGLQLILCGDFYQLPPILDKIPKCMRCSAECPDTIKACDSKLPPLARPGKLKDLKVIRCPDVAVGEDDERKEGTAEACGFERRDTRFIFETETWSECDFLTIELTKVFRQSNVEFVQILEEIRRGRCTNEHITFFENCGSDLRKTPKIKPTQLFPKNEFVDEINKKEFSKIHKAEYQYNAVDEYEGHDAKHHYGDQIKNFPAVRKLFLKEGAQVILLANLDVEGGLVNGSRGVIISFKSRRSLSTATNGDASGSKRTESFPRTNTKEGQSSGARLFLEKQSHDMLPEVLFLNGTTRVLEEHTWDRSFRKGKVVVSTTQIPLNLAWALTIHKVQGQSLDAVQVQLNGAFTSGQAYVALSRAKTPQGMLVTGFSKLVVTAAYRVQLYYERVKEGKPFYDAPATYVDPDDYLFKNHLAFGRLRNFVPPPMRSNNSSDDRKDDKMVVDLLRPGSHVVAANEEVSTWQRSIREAAILYSKSMLRQAGDTNTDAFIKESRSIIEEVLAIQYEEAVKAESNESPIAGPSNPHKRKVPEFPVASDDSDDDDDDDDDGEGWGAELS